MGQMTTRKVEMTAVMADSGYSWNFWVEIETEINAPDEVIAAAARKEAVAALERDGVDVSLVDVAFIEPLDQ
jgi:hypothetical protein